MVEFVFVFLVFSERGNAISFKPKWTQFYSAATAQAQTALSTPFFCSKSEHCNRNASVRLLSEVCLFHTFKPVLIGLAIMICEPLHNALQILQYSKCMRNFFAALLLVSTFLQFGGRFSVIIPLARFKYNLLPSMAKLRFISCAYLPSDTHIKHCE